jgi:hypothetical protein
VPTNEDKNCNGVADEEGTRSRSSKTGILSNKVLLVWRSNISQRRERKCDDQPAAGILYGAQPSRFTSYLRASTVNARRIIQYVLPVASVHTVRLYMMLRACSTVERIIRTVLAYWSVLARPHTYYCTTVLARSFQEGLQSPSSSQSAITQFAVDKSICDGTCCSDYCDTVSNAPCRNAWKRSLRCDGCTRLSWRNEQIDFLEARDVWVELFSRRRANPRLLQLRYCGGGSYSRWDRTVGPWAKKPC